MNCPKCSTANESDALFCTECGAMISGSNATGKTRKVYLYALLLVPVLVLAAGIGYYKYFLPSGIAAEVNGEKITLAELDAAVSRAAGSAGRTDNRLRYQILNSLITERLVLQEARKAGMKIPPDEVVSAVNQARVASGLDEAAFRQRVASEYGSRENFEKAVAQGLLINKYIDEKVVRGNDVRAVRSALDRWLQDLSDGAAIRITLAEQWSGAGCGCCGTKQPQPPNPPTRTGCRMTPDGSARQNQVSAGAADGSTAAKASEAALRYWHEKHGTDDITARVTDFGCHQQIDIIRGAKTIASLRYQAGNITEQ